MKDIDRSDLKSLPMTIKQYLKDVDDRTEKSLLNQFNNYIKLEYGRFKVSDVTATHFEEFLQSLKMSETSFKIYKSILNRFKRHIGLPIPKSHGGRRSKKTELESISYQLYEKDGEIAKHQETINRKDTKIKELNEKIAENKRIHESKPLPYQIRCPLSGEIKLLGNHCHNCPDFPSCPLSTNPILTLEPEKLERR